MSLNTSQIVHIVSEIVALLSVTTYFINENRKMMKVIDSLNEKLEEHDEKMEKYDRVLSDVLKTLEKNNKINPQQPLVYDVPTPPQPSPPPVIRREMGILYEPTIKPISICISQSCIDDDSQEDFEYSTYKVEEIRETNCDEIIEDDIEVGGVEEEEDDRAVIEIASSNKKKRKKKKKSQTLIDIDKELENELNDLYKEEIMNS